MNLLDERIKYDDIIEHWNDHKNWSEWNKCIYIAINIPGREQQCTPEERVEYFMKNYIIENKVKNALGLDFNDDTHIYFHTGRGNPTPDFIDKSGKTYELKGTTRYAYDDKHWWNADIHLYYDRKKEIIYEQIEDGSYIPFALMED